MKRLSIGVMTTYFWNSVLLELSDINYELLKRFESLSKSLWCAREHLSKAEFDLRASADYRENISQREHQEEANQYMHLNTHMQFFFQTSFDGTTWRVIKLHIVTAMTNAVFFIMRHKYVSKRRNFISFMMHLCVVGHNSLHNKLPCLRMLNLNQKAPPSVL